MITLDFSRIPDLGAVRQKRICPEGGEVRMLSYFNELRDDGHDETAICQALMEAVEQERLQPYVLRCDCNPPPFFRLVRIRLTGS